MHMVLSTLVAPTMMTPPSVFYLPRSSLSAGFFSPRADHAFDLGVFMLTLALSSSARGARSACGATSGGVGHSRSSRCDGERLAAVSHVLVSLRGREGWCCLGIPGRPLSVSQVAQWAKRDTLSGPARARPSFLRSTCWERVQLDKALTVGSDGGMQTVRKYFDGR